MLKHRLEIDYQLNDIDAVSPCTNLMLCNQKLTTLSLMYRSMQRLIL